MASRAAQEDSWTRLHLYGDLPRGGRNIASEHEALAREGAGRRRTNAEHGRGASALLRIATRPRRQPSHLRHRADRAGEAQSERTALLPACDSYLLERI